MSDSQPPQASAAPPDLPTLTPAGTRALKRTTAPVPAPPDAEETVACLRCGARHTHDDFIAGLLAIRGTTRANCEAAWTASRLAGGGATGKCHACVPSVRSRARPPL